MDPHGSRTPPCDILKGKGSLVPRCPKHGVKESRKHPEFMNLRWGSTTPANQHGTLEMGLKETAGLLPQRRCFGSFLFLLFQGASSSTCFSLGSFLHIMALTPLGEGDMAQSRGGPYHVLRQYYDLLGPNLCRGLPSPQAWSSITVRHTQTRHNHNESLSDWSECTTYLTASACKKERGMLSWRNEAQACARH